MLHIFLSQPVKKVNVLRNKVGVFYRPTEELRQVLFSGEYYPVGKKAKMYIVLAHDIFPPVGIIMPLQKEEKCDSFAIVVFGKIVKNGKL